MNDPFLQGGFKIRKKKYKAFVVFFPTPSLKAPRFHLFCVDLINKEVCTTSSSELHLYKPFYTQRMKRKLEIRQWGTVSAVEKVF